MGDPVAAGSSFGKVRAMMDDKGRRVKEAGPSMPVEILGLNDVPNAGEVLVGCKNEKEARSFADTLSPRTRRSSWRRQNPSCLLTTCLLRSRRAI